MQQLRLSQLIFNHGPGAILETATGPVVIKDLSCIWNDGFIDIKQPNFYEVKEPRLSMLLGTKINRLCRLPSNAEIGIKDSKSIVSSVDFPNWRLCPRNHSSSGSVIQQVLFSGGSSKEKVYDCPVCDTQASPVRFVSYCRNGHLQEFSWIYSLHKAVGRSHESCKGSYIRFEEAGSSMAQVTLSCSSCGARATLKNVSNYGNICQGLRLEKAWDNIRNRPFSERCDLKLQMTQRQSALIWQSETITALSIPVSEDIDSTIKEFFGHLKNKRRTALQVLENLKKGGAFKENLEGLMLSEAMEELQEELCKFGDEQGFEKLEQKCEEILDETRKVLSKAIFFKREYSFLSNQSKLSKPTTSDVFRINPQLHKDGNINGLKFRVTPIDKLQTVTVLRGYRRGAETEEGRKPKLQLTPVNIDGKKEVNWWITNIQKGEALFIELDELSVPNIGERWNLWEELYDQQCEDKKRGVLLKLREYMFRGIPDGSDGSEWKPDDKEIEIAFAEVHPLFVWWHTFSHHLIRAIQQEAGYSSAAIQERIYAYPIEGSSGKWRGGIILHVTQPGMDGTLGGLISLVDHFQEFLDRVKETMERCSNDPLCSDASQTTIPTIGCYACTFNAETSCEHRNFFLDRLLLEEGCDV